MALTVNDNIEIPGTGPIVPEGVPLIGGFGLRRFVAGSTGFLLEATSQTKDVFRGTDSKLCDPEFSNWDWVAVQRARELGLGARGPDDLHLVFDEKDSPFAVSAEKRDWITEDALRAPKCKVISA